MVWLARHLNHTKFRTVLDWYDFHVFAISGHKRPKLQGILYHTKNTLFRLYDSKDGLQPFRTCHSLKRSELSIYNGIPIISLVQDDINYAIDYVTGDEIW